MSEAGSSATLFSLFPSFFFFFLGTFGGRAGLTPDRIYKIYCKLGQGRLRENIFHLFATRLGMCSVRGIT